MNCVWLSVPLRKSPTEPAHAGGIPLDKSPMDSLLTARRRMIITHKSCEQLAGTKPEREARLAEMVAASEAYITAVSEAVSTSTAVISAAYFFWTASLGPAVHLAIKDVRYDLAMVYFNVAAAHHNAAVLGASEVHSERVASTAGKEAYRLLGEAAAYWAIAQRFVATLNATDAGMLMFDATEKFCGAMGAISLAYAQEVSASVAANNESTKDKPTVAGLCARVAELYEEALIGLTGAESQALVRFRRVVSVKIAAYHALTLAYQARSTMNEDPPSGLRLLEQAKIALKEVKRVNEFHSEHKSRISIVEGCSEVVMQVCARLQQFNEKVYFARPAKDDVPPIKGIPMAQPKPVSATAACESLLTATQSVSVAATEVKAT